MSLRCPRRGGRGNMVSMDTARATNRPSIQPLERMARVTIAMAAALSVGVFLAPSIWVLLVLGGMLLFCVSRLLWMWTRSRVAEK